MSLMNARNIEHSIWISKCFCNWSTIFIFKRLKIEKKNNGGFILFPLHTQEYDLHDNYARNHLQKI